MKNYQNYREFLDDILIWGDCARGLCPSNGSPQPAASDHSQPFFNGGNPDNPGSLPFTDFNDRNPGKTFSALLKKAAASVDQGIFSLPGAHRPLRTSGTAAVSGGTVYGAKGGKPYF